MKSRIPTMVEIRDVAVGHRRFLGDDKPNQLHHAQARYEGQPINRHTYELVEEDIGSLLRRLADRANLFLPRDRDLEDALEFVFSVRTLIEKKDSQIKERRRDEVRRFVERE